MNRALLSNRPVWIEDRDFSGTGVADASTVMVELHFTDPDSGTAKH